MSQAPTPTDLPDQPTAAAAVEPAPPPRSTGPASSSNRLRGKLSIFIASLLLGVLVPLQFRYQKSNPQPNVPAQVSRLVDYLQIEKSKLMADLAEERDKSHRYEEAAGETDTTLRLLKDEVDKARMQAGLMPLQGPGVEARLEDSLRKPGPDDDPYNFIVHDVDIQAVVNELWAAGAEAVSVNDQRVVTNTSVRCVGPTVLVNSVKLSPPYIISAIGAPKTLEAALRMNGGVLNSLQTQLDKGVRFSLTRKKRIEVPEYKGSTLFRYAEAVDAR
jgi:uncharacterized protein YlxW (UPF0749 family)